MSRRKVADDQRRRISQACESCKKRKQKCNGHRPCLTCSKRGLYCSYRTQKAENDKGSSGRRRQLDAGASASHPEDKHGTDTPSALSKLDRYARGSTSQGGNSNLSDTYKKALYSDGGAGLLDADEETEIDATTRMLKDQTGRLLYIGDSATLSYLHLFRRMVENACGISKFTIDPQKERIVETVMTLPPDVHPPCPLADRHTAEILVSSFFTNTMGIVDVFDHEIFHRDMEACYANPLSAKRSFLCLLYLTFAVGLVMATPIQGTIEDDVIYRLRRETPYDQAELFFRSARYVGETLGGFEDGGLWSVQALSLMSIYALAVSKRNASFSYIGMAVRSAIALGLHRVDTMVMFYGHELKLRRGIWKSLYIMDRFISASLGRPTSINESECTDGALFIKSPSFTQPYTRLASSAMTDSKVHMDAVDAGVRNGQIIGFILRKVYVKRRVSNRATQEILEHFVSWFESLPKYLQWDHWSQCNLEGKDDHGHKQGVSIGDYTDPMEMDDTRRAHGVAVLHTNLVFCHTVTLLMRPFFLYLIKTDRQGHRPVASHQRARTQLFACTCVVTSYRAIAMIQSARDEMYLPRRNPFILYYLFSASLIIMNNEFVSLFQCAGFDTTMQNILSIMEYFSATDPQADRLLWILRALHDVLQKSSEVAAKKAAEDENEVPQRLLCQSSLAACMEKPFENFFISLLKDYDETPADAQDEKQDPAGRTGKGVVKDTVNVRTNHENVQGGVGEGHAHVEMKQPAGSTSTPQPPVSQTSSDVHGYDAGAQPCCLSAGLSSLSRLSVSSLTDPPVPTHPPAGLQQTVSVIPQQKHQGYQHTSSADVYDASAAIRLPEVTHQADPMDTDDTLFALDDLWDWDAFFEHVV